MDHAHLVTPVLKGIYGQGALRGHLGTLKGGIGTRKGRVCWEPIGVFWEQLGAHIDGSRAKPKTKAMPQNMHRIFTEIHPVGRHNSKTHEKAPLTKSIKMEGNLQRH